MVYWKMVLSMGALNEMVMVVIPDRAFGRTKIAEAMSPPAFVPETAGAAGQPLPWLSLTVAVLPAGVP